MPIIEPCIRPPSEAESILLQLTCGCSSNTCTFCGAYKNKPFRIKPVTEIYRDIDFYAKQAMNTRKVFLMDGDALTIGNTKLVPILKRILQALPEIRKISSYANAESITERSMDELWQLRNCHLELVYMGLESGSQQILDRCNKKTPVSQMVEAVNKAKECSIHTSVMLLLGLGGKALSPLHIQQSAEAINLMQPRYLNFLSLMLIPGTKLYDEARAKKFEPLDSKGFLLETFEILKLLNLKQTFFFANHASNYLPIQARLPHAKDHILKTLESALNGKITLKPEFFRAL